MTVFAGAVDATFAAFEIDSMYTPAVGHAEGIRPEQAVDEAIARVKQILSEWPGHINSLR